MVSSLSATSLLVSLSLTALSASALSLDFQERAGNNYGAVCTAIAKAIGSSKVYYQG
jgi:hypothetical protein